MEINCPNGHGPMQQVPLQWSLTGWHEPEEGVEPPRPNGQHNLLRLWKCPACGLCQLYDEEPSIKRKTINIDQMFLGAISVGADEVEVLCNEGRRIRITRGDVPIVRAALESLS